MPFWLEKSLDKENGGYFTCLTRAGEVYNTNKFVWLQGREVWMFAYLYCNVEKKKEPNFLRNMVNMVRWNTAS